MTLITKAELTQVLRQEDLEAVSEAESAAMQEAREEAKLEVGEELEEGEIEEEVAEKPVPESPSSKRTLSLGDVLSRLAKVEDNWRCLGMGQVEDNGQRAFFVVVEWPALQEARADFGLPPKDLHITIAFTLDDIHSKPKGKDTIFVSL